MKPLVVEYPEELPGLLKLTEEQFAVEVQFLAAAKLFDLRKLSSGMAAAMAGQGKRREARCSGAGCPGCLRRVDAWMQVRRHQPYGGDSCPCCVTHRGG